MKTLKTKTIQFFSLLVLVILLISCGGVKLQYEKKKLTFNDIDYGFQVKYADLGEEFGKIAYVDEGTGSKTFLFIHGIGDYLKYFYHQIKHLKQNYRVIALDMPGYGKSSNNSEIEYNLPYHVKAISEFIKKLKLDNLVVVGHSYGGSVAIAVSSNNNKLVKNAVFIAPGGMQIFNRQTLSHIKSNMRQLLEDETKINYDLDDFINKWHEKYIYHRTQITDNYLKEYLGLIYSGEIDRIGKTRAKVLKFIYTKGIGNTALIDMFKKMEFPVLIISGDEDKFMPATELTNSGPTRQRPSDFWKNVVSLNSRAKLQIIKDCGHLAVIERPDEMNKAIDEFVSQN
jgi:pimeloyl-ACP methyl ester carboxylesterase